MLWQTPSSASLQILLLLAVVEERESKQKNSLCTQSNKDKRRGWRYSINFTIDKRAPSKSGSLSTLYNTQKNTFELLIIHIAHQNAQT